MFLNVFNVFAINARYIYTLFEFLRFYKKWPWLTRFFRSKSNVFNVLRSNKKELRLTRFLWYQNWSFFGKKLNVFECFGVKIECFWMFLNVLNVSIEMNQNWSFLTINWMFLNVFYWNEPKLNVFECFWMFWGHKSIKLNVLCQNEPKLVVFWA